MKANSRFNANLVPLLFISSLSFANLAPMIAQNAVRTQSQKVSRSSSTQDGRMRPPVIVTCNRNDLTSYTGRVMNYSRRPGLTSLVIQTDWDTTETVELRYPSKSDPSKWFLFRGKAFRKNDWSKIESSRSRLKPDMRVTAWVCSDGKRPIIDWQPSTGNVYPPRATP